MIISILLITGIIFVYYLLQLKHDRSSEPKIKLYLHEQDAIIEINLEEYIKGTVAAEMPATFEMEALKAQAVCARTYAIKKLTENTIYPRGANLSDDINSCQAYIALQNFAPSNPSRRDLLKRITKAVDSTRGEIMLYNSQPIDALYCSTCGGQTESAGAVWGRDIPYLRSIKCGDCASSIHYKESHTIENTIINKLVGDNGDGLSIQVLSRSPGDRPKTISINRHQIDAVMLRKELKLPSAWMEFHPAAHDTVIITRGYGHGVGMCQNGANGMAHRNQNYHQILNRYYSGINYYKLDY